MKDYYRENEMGETNRPPWMTMFISLMLVLLTMFIFLTTFTDTDKKRVEIFRRYFRKTLAVPGEYRMGRSSVTDIGTGVEPVQALIHRMKSTGISKVLMDEFLTVSQIKGLNVMDGKNGLVVIMPEAALFEKDSAALTEKSERYLGGISYLLSQLPYLVEIKGYCGSKIPAGFADSLEFSARRADVVYRYFIREGVAPEKLKVSGQGDALSGGAAPADKVEIILKEAEL